MQVIRQPKTYDVCIVGSGAGGGMAAKVLCDAGADVVMLEAGGMWDTEKDSKMSAWPYDSPRRGAATPDKPFGEFDGCIGGWDIEGEPYTQAAGSRFDWFRGRMLGGRTNHWGRISLRMGPDDFRRRSLDGLGDDWPITYDDIKPYYDKLDRLVGIFGSMENIPNEPDGVFQPPPKPRCYELLIKQAADKLNITCIPNRLSILTQAAERTAGVPLLRPVRPRLLDALELLVAVGAAAAGARDRQAAHHHQRDGARSADRRQRPGDRRLVREPHRSPRLRRARAHRRARGERVRDGAAAAQLEIGPLSRRPRQLERRGRPLPHRFHRPRRVRAHPEDGARRAAQRRRRRRRASLHAVVAGQQEARFSARLSHRARRRTTRSAPGFGFMGGIQRFNGVGGYGKSLKDDYRRFYGATVNFAGRGEMIPNDDTYCEIDPSVVDTYGIPVLRFHARFSEHEINQAKHMQETFREIIHEMGGTPLTPMPSREALYGLEPVGRIIHEVGTTRMGNDPQTSVLNANCQAHDVKNLFVADGGPFVVNAHKNCTWTILALAMRTSEHIAQQRNQGTL